MDPHAEYYYAWSPYSYVGNNPLKHTDPSGMDWWNTNDQDKIACVLEAMRYGKNVDTESFGEQWVRVTDQELAEGWGITH